LSQSKIRIPQYSQCTTGMLQQREVNGIGCDHYYTACSISCDRNCQKNIIMLFHI